MVEAKKKDILPHGFAKRARDGRQRHPRRTSGLLPLLQLKSLFISNFEALWVWEADVELELVDDKTASFF